MKIIKTDIENLENDVVMLYKLTHNKSGKSATKLDDEELEKVYPVDAYLLYEDVNQNWIKIVPSSHRTMAKHLASDIKHSVDSDLIIKCHFYRPVYCHFDPCHVGIC
mgnify:CR=1 FL=1